MAFMIQCNVYNKKLSKGNLSETFVTAAIVQGILLLGCLLDRLQSYKRDVTKCYSGSQALEVATLMQSWPLLWRQHGFLGL